MIAEQQPYPDRRLCRRRMIPFRAPADGTVDAKLNDVSSDRRLAFAGF